MPGFDGWGVEHHAVELIIEPMSNTEGKLFENQLKLHLLNFWGEIGDYVEDLICYTMGEKVNHLFDNPVRYMDGKI